MLSVLTLDFNKQAKWFKDPETFTAADLQPFIDSGINIFHQSIGHGWPKCLRERTSILCAWNGFIANDGDHFIGSIAYPTETRQEVGQDRHHSRAAEFGTLPSS